MRALLPLAALFACVGCQAPPPPVLDATPRFRVGDARVEGLEAFAEVETPIKDLPTHVGFMWEAKVVAAPPGGDAVIEARIVRVVAQLPGDLFSIDTESLIPLGKITGLGRALFKLVGQGFRYTVGPQGDVTLSGWSEALDAAAASAGEALPGDGTVPNSGTLRDALERVYHAPPRRRIKLHETWSRPETYHLSTEAGPAVAGTVEFGYLGMGEQEFEFGDDDLTKEGASVKFTGQAQVTEAGETLFGVVPAQRGGRRGELLFSRSGAEVLMYRELDELQIKPREGLLAVELASLKTGWVFFAEEPWSAE